MSCAKSNLGQNEPHSGSDFWLFDIARPANSGDSVNPSAENIPAATGIPIYESPK